MSDPQTAPAAALFLTLPVWLSAQMTCRLEGTVHDADDKPVAGVRSRTCRGITGTK